MKILRSVAIVFMTGCCMISCKQPSTPVRISYEALYKTLPFEMPLLQRPVFPDNQVFLSDFGGVADGVTLNTDAFTRAMDELDKQQGGTLVVSSGIWLTGPIVFKSNINLHLQKGALIQFTPDFTQYPLVTSIYEGTESRRCQSPISGHNLENIAITGEGSINGSGEAWRPLKKEKVTRNHWHQVVKTGGIVINDNFWFPTEKALKGYQQSKEKGFGAEMTEADWQAIHDFLRPVMINFVSCKNLLLEGVLFENSPNWNIHPLLCENVIIDGIFVRNPGYAQNGDGLDLESCRNVLVINSVFDVGDDAICLKSGKDEEGRLRGVPTENILVDNCKVFQGHGGFVVGSEMSGGVKNILVSNCQFIGTDVGLRFKSCRGRGGVVENIHIRDVHMANIAREALLFDLFYAQKNSGLPADPVMADETTPEFKQISITNMTARNVGRAMLFNGLPEMNIRHIALENIFITAGYGAHLAESDQISFKNVEIIPVEGAALVLDNVKNLQATEFRYPSTLENAIDISGSDTENIQLSESAQLKHIACNKD
ncbi:MAG: glycoside hydrolase family 28 protein [Bacteroidales bacterium]